MTFFFKEKGSDPQALWLDYWKAVHQPYTVFSEAAEPLIHSPAAACHQQQQQRSHDHHHHHHHHQQRMMMDRQPTTNDQDETDLMFRTTTNNNNNRPYESRFIRHKPMRK